jgi:predicted dehydrogenase
MDALELVTVYDTDPSAGESIARLYGVTQAEDLEDALDHDVSAVLVATSAESHYEVTKRCLVAGKHAFVEKPFTTDLSQARDLLRIAEGRDVTCMVDHVYLYSPAVRRLKHMVDGGELGQIVYVTCRRINLGLPRCFRDVIWDLAVHDLSIIDYLFGLDLRNVAVSRMQYAPFSHDTMANITLDLHSGIHANIAVSCLSPFKVREIVVGGTERMAVFDDTKKDKLLVFDKGVVFGENLDTSGVHGLLSDPKYGAVSTVPLDGTLPLTAALQHFAESVLDGREPLTGPSSILSVMRALDTISDSR